MKPEEGQAYGSQIETQQWQQQRRWREEVVFEAEVAGEEGGLEEDSFEEGNLEEGNLEEGNLEEGNLEKSFLEEGDGERIFEGRREEVVVEEIGRFAESRRAQDRRVEEAEHRGTHFTTLAKRREPWWKEILAAEVREKIRLEEGIGPNAYQVNIRKCIAQNRRASTVGRLAEVNDLE